MACGMSPKHQMSFSSITQRFHTMVYFSINNGLAYSKLPSSRIRSAVSYKYGRSCFVDLIFLKQGAVFSYKSTLPGREAVIHMDRTRWSPSLDRLIVAKTPGAGEAEGTAVYCCRLTTSRTVQHHDTGNITRKWHHDLD